jgi:predicted dehydrogenase
VTKKLAFVGLGRISEEHLRGVRALNAKSGDHTLSVSAVVDPYPDRAAQWVARNFADQPAGQRPAILRDYHQLLEPAHRPDLVSILLPHHLHLEVGRVFLDAGIAVQMQKPLGLAIRDARELIEISGRSGTPMTVSEPSVLGRPTRLVLDWLRSARQIGAPTFMIDQAVIDLRGGFFMTPWRHLKGMAGAGWFIDHGVHRNHWMLEAFGPCDSVFAQTRQIEPTRQDQHWGKVDVDTEDLAAAVLRFKSGVIVQWTVMSGGRGQSHRHVQVWGAAGSFHGDKCQLSGKDQPEALALDQAAVAPTVPDDPFAHSYQELLARMAGDPAPMIGDPQRALMAEAIVYACLESAHTGRPVAVDDIMSGRAEQYEQTVWAARQAALAMDLNRLT